MEFNDIFRLTKPPVPIVEFRMGNGDNMQIPGSRDGEFWEVPLGVDTDSTSFLRLGQDWLEFFLKGDVFQIKSSDRLSEGFFDVAALRLPSGCVWIGYCHQLPDDQILLRTRQTLAGAVAYRLDQVQVLGQVIRCFRGVTARVGRKQKHRSGNQ